MKNSYRSVSTFLVVFFLFTLLLSSCQRAPVIDGAEDNFHEKNVLPTAFEYDDLSNDLPLQAQKSNIKYEDGYLYYSRKTFYCYNVKTNIRTYLCKDPVCTHDSSACPLYPSGGFTEYYGGKCYMTKRGYKSGEGFYDYYAVYDPEKNTTAEFARNNTDSAAEMNIYNHLIYDGYLYYYEVYYDDNNGKPLFDFLLKRVSLSGGEPENVIENRGIKREKVLTSIDYLLFGDQGKIYFVTDRQGISYINSDGEDLFEKHTVYSDTGISSDDIAAACFYNGRFVYAEYSETSSGVVTVFRSVDKDGNAKKLFAVNFRAEGVFFTEKYIYFSDNSEKRNIGSFLASDPSNSGAIELPVFRVYRATYEELPELVFDGIPNTSPYITCNVFSDQMIVVGNYLYVNYNNYGSEEKEVYTLDDFSGSLSGFARIDLNTGEMIYVSGND